MKEVWSIVSLGISLSFVGSRLPPSKWAGLPTAVVWGGTSLSTTEPAPIFAPLPMLMLPRTIAPAPINTPSPILGCLSPSTAPVPPNVTWCKMETLLPILAVSPTTNPVAWSNMIPDPISAAGWMSTWNTSETRLWIARAREVRPWFQRWCATLWAWHER